MKRHYEIVLLVHPDQSEQVESMIERYSSFIQERNGIIHRKENAGRRHLAYPINKLYKAHYIVFNIESPTQVIADLENAFKFNDAILRHLIVTRKEAETGVSALKEQNENNNKKLAEKASKVEEKA